MVSRSYHAPPGGTYTPSIRDILLIDPSALFSNFFVTLIGGTYHKISEFARRAQMKRKFDRLSKSIDIEKLKESVYSIRDELPSRLTMYDMEVYSTEIWELIFEKYENKMKKVLEEVMEHTSREELEKMNITLANILKQRVDRNIEEAIEFLLREDMPEENRFYVITYIQGMTMMSKLIETYITSVNTKKDLGYLMDMYSKIILMALVITKYIDGKISPEDYLYNIEFLGAQFMYSYKGEEKHSTMHTENIISLLHPRSR